MRLQSITLVVLLAASALEVPAISTGLDGLSRALLIVIAVAMAAAAGWG
jgi:hypothetical protein